METVTHIILPLMGLLTMIALLIRVMGDVADDMVPLAERMAIFFKMTETQAGASFLAAPSSASEAALALIGALTKRAGEGFLATVGSGLFNSLVIAGLSMIKARHEVELPKMSIRRDLAAWFFTTLWLTTVLWDGKVTLVEGGVGTLIYVIYLTLLFKVDTGEMPIQGQNSTITIKMIGQFLFLVAAIGWLSHLTLEFSIELAHGLGIPAVIISITLIAGGSSVPDLRLSLVQAGKAAMGDLQKLASAISNAFGSNSFDNASIAFSIVVATLLYGTPVLIVSIELIRIGLMTLTVVTFLIPTLLEINRYKSSVRLGYEFLLIYVWSLLAVLLPSFFPNLSLATFILSAIGISILIVFEILKNRQHHNS